MELLPLALLRVAMPLYLSKHSHPDIAFAVQQCARFSHCSCATYEVALKKICGFCVVLYMRVSFLHLHRSLKSTVLSIVTLLVFLEPKTRMIPFAPNPALVMSLLLLAVIFYWFLNYKPLSPFLPCMLNTRRSPRAAVISFPFATSLLRLPLHFTWWLAPLLLLLTLPFMKTTVHVFPKPIFHKRPLPIPSTLLLLTIFTVNKFPSLQLDCCQLATTPNFYFYPVAAI